MKDRFLRIQTGEWMEICLTIVVLFFQKFDMSLYATMRANNIEIDHKVSNINPKQMIHRIYLALKLLLEGEASHIIGVSLAEEITITMNTLIPHIDFDEMVDGDIHNAVNESKFDTQALKQIKIRRKRDSVIYEDIQQITHRNKFKEFVCGIKFRYNYYY
jgi:hypothetical protein